MMCFNNNFWVQQNLGRNKKKWGSLPPNAPPRAYGPAFTYVLRKDMHSLADRNAHGLEKYSQLNITQSNLNGTA